MIRQKFFALILFVVTLISYAQVNKGTNPIFPSEITGRIVDTTNSPIPYISIINIKKNSGGVSNELGEYTINIDGLKENDTIRFQSIGYKTENFAVQNLISNSNIVLKEDVYIMNEVLVLNKKISTEQIVKNVLKKKKENYLNPTSRQQIFLRERFFTDFETINLNYKKSSFTSLDKKMIESIEKKLPKNQTFFNDFLFNIYYSNDADAIKISPIKAVSLKQDEISELKYFENTLKQIFTNTDDKEYLKIKSGIFGQKIPTSNDSDIGKKDSLNTSFLNFNISTNYKKFIAFEDKNKWDFLYNTSKYEFEMNGGTTINDEDVYIISFKPKNKGLYVGKLYITIDSYALIKADFEFDIGKSGRDFEMLGVGYEQINFSGSIYFEKEENSYVLKHFSYKSMDRFKFDRNLSLLKKKKRFLMDKKLNEIKINLDLIIAAESSIEYAVIKNKNINNTQYESFIEPKKFKIIYVNQFDKNQWKGYSIIEPIEKMKAYKLKN